MKERSARKVSTVAAIITMAIGVLVIIGWCLNNDFLISVLPGQVKMKFNVALGFIFSSIVVLLFLYSKKNNILHSLSIILSCIVFLIGGLTLTEYIFQINLGIDELFINDELRTFETYFAGRMSPISAVSFMFIGIGLLLLNNKKSVAFHFSYLSAISLIALLMLVCFNLFTDIPTILRLSIHVAIGFIALCAAIYYAQPAIQQQISFEAKLVTSFFAAILLLVVISMFSSYYNDRRLYTSNRADNTNLLLDEVRQTFSLIKDIEGGGRGYIMTGDSSYLSYFIAAKKSMPDNIKSLKRLTTGNSIQEKNIDSLETLINKRIDFSDESIRLRNEKGLDPAIRWTNADQGKYYSDRIRYFAEEIQKSEKDFLVETEQKHEKSISAFNQAFYTLLAVVGSILLFIFFVVRYNLKKRKMAEEQTKENEQQIETIFKAAPDAVVAINSDGRIVRWNTKAEILFGWSAEEATGKLLAETIIPQRYRQAHKTGMKNFLKTGEGPVLGKTIEIEALRKDETEFDIALSISPTIIKNKHLFIGFIHDITDKKKAEKEIIELNTNLEKRVIERTEELLESEKKYRYLFESNPIPMWIIDIDAFRFLNVNDAAVTHYGYSREEFLSMTAVDIRPTSEKQKFLELNRSENVGTRSRGTWKHLKKDGSVIDVEIITHEIFYEGKAARFILSNDVTEKVKAEEKLANEKQLLRTLIDNLPDYIYFKDTQSRHLVNNKANLQFMGVSSEEETVGKSVVDFFGPKAAKSFIEDDKFIMKTGVTVTNMEEVLELKTGQVKYLLTTKVPVKDRNGKVTGLVGISRDITKQKYVELQLRDSKYFLEKAQKVGQIGHWISERGTGKLTWSEEACRIFGIDPNKFDGRIETFLNLVHPDDVEKLKSATVFAFKNNQPYSIDHRIVLKDGEIKWVNEQGEIITGENGDATTLMGIVQDISERKIVEERIKQSEKIYKTIASHIPGSMICLFDRDYRYTLVEGDMLEKLGHSSEALLGKKISEVSSPERYALFLPDLIRVFKGETFSTDTIRSGYDIITRYVPLKNEDDQVYAAMSVSIDVTELKNAQRKIFEMNLDLEKKVLERTRQLEDVNKELEAFTYSVSHDLRAPLRIIDGFAGILRADFADKLDDEGNRTLGVIMNNAQRMGQLIDDLLNLSRLGRQDVRMNTINMERMVKSIIDDELLLNNKHFKITYQQLLQANCDNGLIRQVWINLISNAIKYSSKQENPHITIGSYQKENYITYFVKDNGVGFDMKYAGKLFGVFQRLHKPTEFEGTGVGLALVQRIISKHGGKVWAHSEMNKGSIFYFSLPAT